MKKESESFKEYAQRWTEIVAQVKPLLGDWLVHIYALIWYLILDF